MAKVNWLKEEFWELTPKQEDEVLCRADFVNVGVRNYQKMVNTKPRKDEIGYIPHNGIRKRLIVKQPNTDLETRRRRAANNFEDKFRWFVPYYQYENGNTNKKEIGRMFGCKIIL